MSARRGALVGVIAAALFVVGLAPSGVTAAPASVVTGDDPLAATAAAALAAFHAHEVGDTSSLREFHRLRDLVATDAAERLEYDPAEMRAAWRAADLAHQVAVLAAFTQLGTPYRKNARSPGEGFDCSGLTSWAWEQAGVSIFHQSRTQIREATALTHDTAQAGDLVYYPGHVMLYLGTGEAMIHAPFPGRSVEVIDLPNRRVGRVKYGSPVPVSPVGLTGAGGLRSGSGR